MTKTFYWLLGIFFAVVILATGIIFIHKNQDFKQDVKQYFAAKLANEVLEDYVDKTVLKTLALLVEDVSRLNEAILKLKSDKNDVNVSAAADAWRKAHGTYKMTSAFLYGPAAHYDFHKQLATWPFDIILIDHALKEMESGKLQLNSRILREEKYSAMRGFYSAEYLLFRKGLPRRAQDISAVELNYLESLALALLEESTDFEASWLGTENLPPQKIEIIKKAGIKTRKSYADEFKNPGKSDSRYASLSIPLQEIFQEMTGVLEDMLPVIGELYDVIEPENLNYWDSHNAFSDLISEIQGIENAYLGGVKGRRGASVSNLVASYSSVLDRRIKIAIAHTAYRINEINDFKGANKDHEKKELAIRVAEAECEKLLARLTAAAPLVTLDDSVSPWAVYDR